MAELKIVMGFVITDHEFFTKYANSNSRDERSMIILLTSYS